eukprot:1658811-Rhodomonas_salina.1
MSSVTCKAARGMLGSMGIGLTVGQMGGSLSEASSYDHDTWVDANRTSSNIPVMSNGTAVRILAAAFGAGEISAKSSVGSTACESSTWMSESAIACR